ncbi:hypothetical protein [Actinomadura hibisca]|uniref:hypothetical protein n=1 Tax=Actinomadura hibisca TaxID=68565 RepID=UPI000831FC1E|nr:hypothetical protein [Actinomadura hibisca]
MSERLKSTARRVAVGALVIGAFSAEVALPAHAEGQFRTNISSWYPGKTSRAWSDKNNDGWKTAVEMAYCSGNSRNVMGAQVELRRHRRLRPDASYGNRAYVRSQCRGSRASRGQWGDQTAGSYRFKLSKINNGQGTTGYTWSARWVGVYY